MSSDEQSIQSARTIPNPDGNHEEDGDGMDPTEREVQRLANTAQLIVPSTDWVKAENDTGDTYFHVGDGDGLVDYYIQANHSGYWEGVSNGRLGLLRPFRAPTAQAVAVMAAMALANQLIEIAKDAGAILMGF